MSIVPLALLAVVGVAPPPAPVIPDAARPLPLSAIQASSR